MIEYFLRPLRGFSLRYFAVRKSFNRKEREGFRKEREDFRYFSGLISSDQSFTFAP